MRREKALELLRKHWDEISEFGVTSLRLFGSVARDEAVRESDVDLLVGFGSPPSFSEYMRLRIYLEDLLGSEVDLITEGGLRERVRPYVEKDSIRVT